MPKTKLYQICHARPGDKGDTVSIGLVCFDAADCPWIERLDDIRSLTRLLVPGVPA